MIRVLILVALVAAGCVLPGSLVAVPGSRALVSGTDRTRAIIERYEHRVIEVLGTEWPRPYIVTEEGGDPFFRGSTRTLDRRVRLHRNLDGRVSPLTLLHELAHVHMRGPWRELPSMLQEGVADWIALSMLGRPLAARLPAPRLTLQVRVLTLSQTASWSAPDSDELKWTAVWMAARLFSKERPGDLMVRFHPHPTEP